ncbi:MAG: hypothetical protein IJH78_00430 [Clostridia bacterium]|nr:hypothetical protein [Clostridia bacterium]
MKRFVRELAAFLALTLFIPGGASVAEETAEDMASGTCLTEEAVEEEETDEEAKESIAAQSVGSVGERTAVAASEIAREGEETAERSTSPLSEQGAEGMEASEPVPEQVQGSDPEAEQGSETDTEQGPDPEASTDDPGIVSPPAEPGVPALELDGESETEDGVHVIRLTDEEETIRFIWNAGSGDSWHILVTDGNGTAIWDLASERAEILFTVEDLPEDEICTIRVSALLGDTESEASSLRFTVRAAVEETGIAENDAEDEAAGEEGEDSEGGADETETGDEEEQEPSDEESASSSGSSKKKKSSSRKGSSSGKRSSSGKKTSSDKKSKSSSGPSSSENGKEQDTHSPADTEGACATALSLNGNALEITLDGGAAPFTARFGEGVLTLTPADEGSVWRISTKAMRQLQEEGIGTIRFLLEEQVREFSLEKAGAAEEECSEADGPLWSITADGVWAETDGLRIAVPGLLPEGD